jgi:hypothetical protein
MDFFTNFVKTILGLDPGPHRIRIQQKDESGFGFSEYGSETLFGIQIKTESRVQTRTESQIQIRRDCMEEKTLQFLIKNEREELHTWSRCCARVSSLFSSSPPPLPWRRQPLAAPPQPSTRT